MFISLVCLVVEQHVRSLARVLPRLAAGNRRQILLLASEPICRHCAVIVSHPRTLSEPVHDPEQIVPARTSNAQPTQVQAQTPLVHFIRAVAVSVATLQRLVRHPAPSTAASHPLAPRWLGCEHYCSFGLVAALVGLRGRFAGPRSGSIDPKIGSKFRTPAVSYCD